MPVFSRSEMDRRYALLRRRMKEHELDAVIATSYAGFYYLAGAPIHPFGRPMAVLVPLEDNPVIVEPFIERPHTRLQSLIEDIRVYWDYNPTPSIANPQPPLKSMIHLLGQAVRERGLESGRIGIEDALLPLAHYRALQGAFPNVELVAASDLIERLRLVKSQEELALIRAADRIADHGQQLALELIRPGQTADLLNSKIRNAMNEFAFQEIPDMPFIAQSDVGLGATAKSAGHSDWITWGRSDEARPGQVLATVFSTWVWGYSGNVERAIAVGEPHGRQRELFELMVEMNERAITATRPGVRVAEIDRLCKELLAQNDLITPTGTGIGRGITSYEGNARELQLDVRLYNDLVLEPGMVFSIEPHVREDDVVYRHCNTIIVTEGGCEVDSEVSRGVLWV
ncbi:MAG TPA: Xaa-Pro peptidase family protein [Kiloniellales bacterium]